ncbi:MAG: hypothetical protein GY765_17930, partial [bacterium]|nr:hypothetical protein [bacterium]
VKKQPRKNAFEVGEETLTYRDLDDESSRLAALIQQSYDARYSLSREEKHRYMRQMLLDGWGVESQEKLKSTTVFVAGAGGGASPIVTQLALAGVGTIIICDYDEVELSNLNRQFLHDNSRIGINKALSAKETIHRINPHVKVIAHTIEITRENVLELVGESAILFDMLDDMASKFILSKCAAAKGIPHIISAMAELNGYSAIFHTPHTPCFHCLYDISKVEELGKMKQKVKGYRKNPLHVVASSLFVAGGFAVTEALKIILGFENPGYNKFFLFNQKGTRRIVDTDGYRMMTYPFSRYFKEVSREQGFD